MGRFGDATATGTDASLETVPVASCALDDRGCIEAVNAAAARLLGACPAELAGRSLLEAASIREASELREHLRHCLGTTETVCVELEAVAPRGRRMLLLASTARRNRPGGAGVHTVIIDVTSPKAIQGTRERRRSLVAHELRQPLGTIMLSIGLLVRGKAVAPSASQLVERMDRAVETLSRMVDDLVEGARGEGARLRLRRENVDLVRLTNEVVARATPTLERPVRVQAGAGPLTVDVDPGRFEEILLDVLSHAAKHGAPESEILARVEPGESEVVVAVEQEGSGLASEESSVARVLVEAHGGRLSVASEPGRTTVSFTIPSKAMAHRPWRLRES